MSSEQVKVVVEYVGQDPFEEKMSVNTPLHTVKSEALDEFELEQSSADRYILKHNGAVLTNENATLRDFNAGSIVLQLSLKEETEKG